MVESADLDVGFGELQALAGADRVADTHGVARSDVEVLGRLAGQDETFERSLGGFVWLG